MVYLCTITPNDMLMAIIDRIKYDGPSNGSQWLIYKYPSEKFVLGSQLIVNQGQEALFFKGGEALDLFGPGTHTLSTGNLPILNTLVNLPFGGKTPFTAEVYYINKTVNMDMKWGTSNQIPLEDPKYGLIINIGARGQYGITITDSRLFVSKIIGAMQNGHTVNHILVMRYFNGMINSKIKAVTAQYMINKRISFLEITSYLTELSDAFKEQLDDEFERFGIELTHFYCVSIAPKPDDYKKLQGYKEDMALGAEFYKTRRSLDIMEKMADNPNSGGMASAGIGVGMGMGIAGQVSNLFTGIGNTVNPNDSSIGVQSSTSEMEVACPRCGTKNSKKMKYCGGCGAELQSTVICPSCGAKIPAGMKYCGVCGQPISAIKCSACGFENKPGMRFCGNCGQKL